MSYRYTRINNKNIFVKHEPDGWLSAIFLDEIDFLTVFPRFASLVTIKLGHNARYHFKTKERLKALIEFISWDRIPQPEEVIYDIVEVK